MHLVIELFRSDHYLTTAPLKFEIGLFNLGIKMELSEVRFTGAQHCRVNIGRRFVFAVYRVVKIGIGSKTFRNYSRIVFDGKWNIKIGSKNRRKRGYKKNARVLPGT